MGPINFSCFNCTSNSFLIKSLALFILFGVNVLKAQDKVIYSVQVSKTLSASGISGQYNPSLAASFNKVSLVMGPNIRIKGHQLSGANAEIRFSPEIENTSLNLFFHFTSIYNQNATIKSNSDFEIQLMISEKVDKNVNSFENYFGFGLEQDLLKNLKLHSSIGVGYFHHSFSDGDNLNMASLFLKAGLSFYINKPRATKYDYSNLGY